MNIGVRDSMEMLVDEDRLVLKKFHPYCVLCGHTEAVSEFRGKAICANCRAELATPSANIQTV